MHSNPTIENNVIRKNNSDGQAGGVYCEFSTNFIMRNNLIYENMSNLNGGGIYFYYTDPNIINCTIAGNGATNGGGLFCDGSSPIIVNSIFWENAADEEGDQILAGMGSNPQISYCDIQGGWPGEGNIDIFPDFRDSEEGDYHLMAVECDDPVNSPCIDAGCPEILDSLIDCDWGMGGSGSDIGAYGGGDSAAVEIPYAEESIPTEFRLYPAYPNPFNSSTVLNYYLHSKQAVTISIYDALGRRVETLLKCVKQPGIHSITWGASGQSSGIYFARLTIDNQNRSIKMILSK